MNTFGGNQIKPMIFCFDALNPKCHTPGTHEFRELITGTPTVAVVASGKTLAIDSTLGSPHLRFVPGATTRTVYIPFPVATNKASDTGVRVPTGTLGTWSVWAYFQDQGNIDHPFFGWETGSNWDGLNGFVLGTGYGTDGPRPGVGGQQYGYGGMEYNKWINWTMTYDANASNGLKIYKNGQLNYQATPSVKMITGNNNNPLHIGATNNRGGNWGGYLDLLQMWDVPLTANEVYWLYQQHKGRF